MVQVAAGQISFAEALNNASALWIFPTVSISILFNIIKHEQHI
jgi:hypothetical protein